MLILTVNIQGHYHESFMNHNLKKKNGIIIVT